VAVAEAEKDSIAENQRIIVANQAAIVEQQRRLEAAERREKSEAQDVILPDSNSNRHYLGPTVMPYYR
jgi:hypothetical protein